MYDVNACYSTNCNRTVRSKFKFFDEMGKKKKDFPKSLTFNDDRSELLLVDVSTNYHKQCPFHGKISSKKYLEFGLQIKICFSNFLVRQIFDFDRFLRWFQQACQTISLIWHDFRMLALSKKGCGLNFVENSKFSTSFLYLSTDSDWVTFAERTICSVK